MLIILIRSRRTYNKIYGTPTITSSLIAFVSHLPSSIITNQTRIIITTYFLLFFFQCYGKQNRHPSTMFRYRVSFVNLTRLINICLQIDRVRFVFFNISITVKYLRAGIGVFILVQQ